MHMLWFRQVNKNKDKQKLEKKIGKVENKIATTAILNINIGEIENQIPDTSELATTVLLNILVKLRMKFLMLVV